MWQFCVEFLGETGEVLKSTYVSATNERSAVREALRAEGVPDDYWDLEATRLS